MLYEEVRSHRATRYRVRAPASTWSCVSVEAQAMPLALHHHHAARARTYIVNLGCLVEQCSARVVSREGRWCRRRRHARTPRCARLLAPEVAVLLVLLLLLLRVALLTTAASTASTKQAGAM